MSRFDNRSEGEFKKDIYFTTNIETLFFNMFVESCAKRSDITLYSHEDNGIDNDGSFIPEGVSTAGADYLVDMDLYGKVYYDLPLEVKWAPTYGKATLKVGDLRAYIKEGAAILFFYTSKYLNLKKPKNRDLQTHIQTIIEARDHLRWGIMTPVKLIEFLELNKENIKPISYMGNKPGIILKQEHFKNWFKEEKL